MEKKLTIYDISEKAGVSIATVSRVLNGSDRVSQKTRERVLQIVAESGYTPNVFARGLGLDSMHTIGIVCADSSDLFLAKAVYYIEESLRAKGYECLLCCTGYDQKSIKQHLSLLLSKKIDACVMIGSGFVRQKAERNRYIREMAQTIPVFLLNSYINSDNIYCTLSNDTECMYEAAKTLWKQGCRRILYFEHNSTSYSGAQKRKGYERAMEECGIAETERLMTQYHGKRDRFAAMVAHLDAIWESGVEFDAVLASEDQLAVAAVQFAKKRGKKIPEEFGVIGYNNSILSECCDPNLTSVDNHLEEMCRHLTDVLYNRLQEEPVTKKIIVGGELVLRDTTKKG